MSREAWFCLVVGCAMFVVGTVYGGVDDVERSGAACGRAVDLPAATAIQPHVYPDGSLSPDYKDAAIATLQYALAAVTDDLEALQEHDADIHRGACVPWEDK